MNPIQAIRTAIESHGLIPEGTKVVAGVSGGADSMALMHAFHQLSIPVTIAHLNHRLRGNESDNDAAFVRQIADELGVPAVFKSVDVKALAAETGASIEMAARQARHDFFSEFGEATIALAHHADDQIETFFLKLARGAGPEGLSGMPYVQRIGSLRLIRPLLDLRRSALVEWLEANNYTWREDTSNADEAFLRNRIRHTILPLLEDELNPNIRNTIRRTMNILQQENGWMDGMLKGVSIDEMADLPRAAQRRLLRKWLFEQGITDAGFDTVEQIRTLIEQGEGSSCCTLNERKRVVVEYGRPRLEHTDRPPDEAIWSVQIETGIGWKKDPADGIGELPAEASFDAERVGTSPISVRTFQPGDRMEPMGMTGSRKLQDIFTDLKIPRAQRNSIPVVICRGAIIWLPGYRIDRSWAVQGDQGKSVTVRIEQKATP